MAFRRFWVKKSPSHSEQRFIDEKVSAARNVALVVNSKHLYLRKNENFFFHNKQSHDLGRYNIVYIEK